MYNISRMCESYIRGVVETWFIKDVVGLDGPNYQYDGRGRPTFCARILKVSSDEWTSIVRKNLRSLKPGFASHEVMRILHEALCS
jgi:hypothetical protein